MDSCGLRAQESNIPLLRLGHELDEVLEIRFPSRPFEPAFAAQRFDNKVCRFGTCSEQFDDFLSRRFPTAALAEGKHDPTFRVDRDRAAKGMSFSVTKPPEIGGFVTEYCITCR